MHNRHAGGAVTLSKTRGQEAYGNMTEVEFIVGLLWAQMEASEKKRCTAKVHNENYGEYCCIYILV